MVFQNYALFPHTTAAQHIEYALRVRRLDTNERAAKDQKALEKVQMGPFGKRNPGQLSGGSHSVLRSRWNGSAGVRQTGNRPKPKVTTGEGHDDSTDQPDGFNRRA
jgi:hypothetical protein